MSVAQDAVSPNFYDISRLEVVKGPQGTLYGRNSTGGAINLITANPTFDEFKGYVNTEIGTYNLFRVENGGQRAGQRHSGPPRSVQRHQPLGISVGRHQR